MEAATFGKPRLVRELKNIKLRAHVWCNSKTSRCLSSDDHEVGVIFKHKWSIEATWSTWKKMVGPVTKKNKCQTCWMV